MKFQVKEEYGKEKFVTFNVEADVNRKSTTCKGLHSLCLENLFFLKLQCQPANK